RCASLTTPAGTTTYTYDAASRLVTVTDPHGSVTTYSYESRGNLTGRSLPDGVTSVYAYDQLDRLISQVSTDGSTLLLQDLYTLDAGGQRTSIQETDQTGSV